MTHTALRLPSYQPALNPIGLVWASLKEYLCPFPTSRCLGTMLEIFTLPNHASRKCEEEFLTRQKNIDAVVDEFIIILGDDSVTMR